MPDKLTNAQARLLLARGPVKAQKYRAKPLTVDGHRFPSQLEARRYGVLKMLERAGRIRKLTLQPRFELVAQGVKVAEYRADFAYEELRRPMTGAEAAWFDVVEDAKGMVLPLYKLKRALFLALNPHIDFREVTR